MEVWVNGSRLDPASFPDDMDLESVLARVGERYVPPGETITEVIVNGRSLSPAEEREQGAVAGEALDRIEIQTQNPAELAYESLKESARYLDRLIPGLTRVAELFRGEDPVEASRLLVEALEGIRWFGLMIESSEPFVPVDYAHENLEATTVEAHYRRLQDHLTRLSEAQRGGRWDRMADIVGGELKAYFEQWRRMVDQMVHCCETRGPN